MQTAIPVAGTAAAAAPAASLVAVSPAAAVLTPAAAARARKLAAGGMDFVERPNAVYISPRNLAPPPPAAPIAPIDSIVAAASNERLGPVVVPFSFVRWLSTSRSVWSWVVRALGVATAVGIAFACVKVYEAWLVDMQRRQQAREASLRARMEREQADKQATSSSVDAAASSDVPSAASSASSSVGAANFQTLSTLLCTRYALLQRYASVLKHVQLPAATPAAASIAGASASSSIVSAVAAPPSVALSDAAKLKLVFDELESSLHENAYLKDLLRRINGQMAKG